MNGYKCVIYTTEGEHKHKSQLEMLSHGNSESDRSFLKTTKAAIKDVNKLFSSAKSVCDTILDNFGYPYLSS